jgi:putative DNA primase/helicase
MLRDSINETNDQDIIGEGAFMANNDKNSEDSTSVENVGDASTGASTPTSLRITASASQIEVLDQLLTYIKPVNFRDYLKIPEDVKITSRHIVVGVIKSLRETAEFYKWNIAKVYDYLFVYNKNYWSKIDVELFKTFLGAVAIKMGIEAYNVLHFEFKNNLLKQFLTDGFLAPPTYTSKEILINLQNGTYEIVKGVGRLRDFDPKDFLTYQLPFEYDEKAECKLFKAYLDKVLPDKESQQVLQEFMAYVFTPEMNLEKCLVLLGSGQNGKSVFFNIMCAILGESNVLNYQMSSFSHEYKRAKLLNVLLNYSSEKGNELEVDIFKALISGEPLQAREPYGQSFTIKNKVRFVINANELPKETEQTDAFFRRFLIVPFDVKISEEDKDPNLAAKIIESELPGVFNWILEGLDRLVFQQKFTDCEKSTKAVEEYRKSSDSIALFVEECNVMPDLNTKTALKDLYQDYKSFCTDDNYRPFAKRRFGHRLETLGFEKTRLNDGNCAFFIKRAKKKFSLGSFGYSVNSEKDINLNELNFLNEKNNINFNTQNND